MLNKIYYSCLLLLASIASRFHITKYPTLKLLRNGQAAKKEYRGQRSADAISNFIGDQLKDPINKINHLNDLQGVEVIYFRQYPCLI